MTALATAETPGLASYVYQIVLLMDIVLCPAAVPMLMSKYFLE